MWGNHCTRAVREFCRFVRRRGSLALHRWLGFHDLQCDAGRQLYSDGDTIEYRQNDLHAFPEPLRLSTHYITRNLQLLISIGVHEMIAVPVLVQKIKILVLDEGPLHLLRSL